jgi:precorrin-2 dehydrogenase/sirohydrochlorin ferrochelatase
MPFGYPISLEVSGRKAVVIGEEAVLHGKVEGLLSAGADVTVVAEGPSKKLQRLETDPRVTVVLREFAPSDLDGAFVAIASSDDPDLRARIYEEAKARGVLVNVMDDVAHCDWAAPAVVRRGDLVISISTGGRSPALARRLREELEQRFGNEWSDLIDVVGDVREETLAALPDIAERSKRWRVALDLEELEQLIASGRRDEARVRLMERLVGAPR